LLLIQVVPMIKLSSDRILKLVTLVYDIDVIDFM